LGATEEIASFIVNTGYSEIPQRAVAIAKRSVLDGIAVALAGSLDPGGRIISQYVRDMGGRPQAGVIGGGFKTSPPEAALANGTLIHALDWDDVSPSWMVGHPTATILPACLALGEVSRASGKELLEAYIVGFEVGSKLGIGIGGRHYEAGWHSTATLGTMGAAAAAAKILKLTAGEVRMALGIAASMAGGLRQNFGTMTKQLHAGIAARNGVVAAMLAKRGFTSDENILETPFGFFRVLGGGGEGDIVRMSQGLGNPFDIISPGVSLKVYPCCSEAHRCIDALFYLVRKHRFSPDDVVEMICHTSGVVPQILIHHSPQTGLQAKFSMEYLMAVALLDGEVSPEQFTDERVQDPRVQELMERVSYRHHEGVTGMEGLRLPEAVTVRLKNGREYSYQVERARGTPENPLTDEELNSKLRQCARLVLSGEEVETLLELVSGLEELGDISKLASILTGLGS